VARTQHDAATETLHEIDGFFDRIANWAAANQPVAWGLLAGILGVTLIVSVVGVVRDSSRKAASEAVGEAQTDYLEAMGANSFVASFAEPANPETARATREEYAARLAAAADAHAGTAPAAAGRIEEAGILGELGDEEGAIAALRTAVEEAPAGSALQGVALVDLAVRLEETSPADASRAYERAGRIDDFPGAPAALAHAARTALDAGETARALALFDEIESAADDGGNGITAPPFIAARLREARAAAAAAPPAAAAAPTPPE